MERLENCKYDQVPLDHPGRIRFYSGSLISQRPPLKNPGRQNRPL